MRTVAEVVEHGACVGCGFCVAHSRDSYCMVETDTGIYQSAERASGAGRSEDQRIAESAVCPFLDNVRDEDDIAREIFGQVQGIRHRSEIGYFLQLSAGAVTDEKTRLQSSSGGILSWLCGQLLSRGEADVIACVGPVDEDGALFNYRLVHGPAELAECRKSRYYPVHVAEVIQRLREDDERVVFVGLPCFVKGLRLLLDAEPELKARVVCTIGLFCGHLKSKRYATYLWRTVGLEDQQVKAVNFRKKLEGRPANEYAFEAQAVVNGTEETHSVIMRDVFAGRWGTNLFMLEACNWCDDIMAETADVAVGDAWLNEFSSDYRGHSLMVVRNPRIAELLKKGEDSGQIDRVSLTENEVVRSQAGGLRHRRTGLAYRLAVADTKGVPHPKKRVKPNRKAGGRLFQMVLRLREGVRRTSHHAMREQLPLRGLERFRRRIWLGVTLLEGLYVLRSHARPRLPWKGR